MIDNKLITLTGPDLCGKLTQADLLRHMIESAHGSCSLMGSPDYSQPCGKIIGAMLDSERQSLVMSAAEKMEFQGNTSDVAAMLRDGNWHGPYHKKGRELVFHALYTANYYDIQEGLKNALEQGHVVMDRYLVDDWAFGMTDLLCKFDEWGITPGNFAPDDINYQNWRRMSALDWITNMQRYCRQSDQVILLHGAKFSRSGEIMDIHESDDDYLAAVNRNYLWLADTFGWIVVDISSRVIGTDDIKSSIGNVGRDICGALIEAGFNVPFDEEVFDRWWNAR